jgi:hypothetical protein
VGNIASKNLSAFVLIFPLLLAFIFTAVGYPIYARDDINYLNELNYRSFDIFTIDYIG